MLRLSVTVESWIIVDKSRRVLQRTTQFGPIFEDIKLIRHENRTLSGS